MRGHCSVLIPVIKDPLMRGHCLFSTCYKGPSGERTLFSTDTCYKGPSDERTLFSTDTCYKGPSDERTLSVQYLL